MCTKVYGCVNESIMRAKWGCPNDKFLTHTHKKIKNSKHIPLSFIIARNYCNLILKRNKSIACYTNVKFEKYSH